MSGAAAELEKIIKELADEDYSKFPAEEILELRKKTNPYGRTIEGSDRYLNFSITQIHHEYWKKLIITAFVGFLNRMNDEWKVPDGVPVVPVYEYLEDKSKLDTPAMVLNKGDKSAIYDYEFNRKWMEKRVVVKEFLEEFLQFNPDEHVRSGYRPNRGDNTRKPVDTEAGQLAVEHLKSTDKDFRGKEQLYEDVQSKIETKTESKQPKIIKKTITDPTTGKQKVVLTKSSHSTGSREPVDKSTMKDPDVVNTTREMIPPHDTFGRFKLYLTSNYEELRDAVKDLYCEKPEFELAINPYSWHDNKDDAETFKKKHANEVIAEIFTAHSGKWNFFDSFKEQRDNVNFYNDQTIIMEEMIKQLERDEKLGQDLMKKRVAKKKKQNIIEAGPDAESFKKWRAQNNELKKLGAAYAGDQADPDCPDDAVQVDVWKIAKGGTEITKEKFFSAAEAPTFVKEAQDKAMASGDMARR